MDDSQLEPAAHLLTEAAAYWKHANAKHHGAVQWIEGENGELLMYTRGEYRDQLLLNIIAASPPAAPLPEPAAPFGWLFEGPQLVRQFTKAGDFSKPILDEQRRMADTEPNKYTLTALYDRPAASGEAGTIPLLHAMTDVLNTIPAAAPLPGELRDERKAFEEWALTSNLAYRDPQIGICFHSVSDGNPSWKAWQARASLSAAPVEQQETKR